MCRLWWPAADYDVPPRRGRPATVDENCRSCRGARGKWNSRLKSEGLAVLKLERPKKGRPAQARQPGTRRNR